MPLLNSAIGLCFVAFLDSPSLRARLDSELTIQARASAEPVSVARARIDLLVAEARQQGMSRAVGSVLPGINAFCSPVFDHEGKMVIAITGLGPASLFPADWDGAIPRAIQDAAGQISRRLGWKA